jgi:peptidoglycan hydrolase CwlO-like protein
MENDIFKIAEKLPNTSNIILSLQNLDGTINELLQYIKNLEDENTKLKSEMIDLYEKLNSFVIDKQNEQCKF